MKQFFITGTDTGVGKTFVSAVLMSMLQAHYWKPIQSGLEDEISDQEKVQQLTGKTDEYFIDSVYKLQKSLSPDQAAKLENVSIDVSCLQLPDVKNHLIVEGAGGVFVPLNDNKNMLDLMEVLRLPIIVVARGGLGTVNHTLLTIAALKQRGLNIYGIIFNGDLNVENQLAIEKWSGVKTLLHVPRFENLDRATLESWLTINSELLEV